MIIFIFCRNYLNLVVLCLCFFLNHNIRDLISDHYIHNTANNIFSSSAPHITFIYHVKIKIILWFNFRYFRNIFPSSVCYVRRFGPKPFNICKDIEKQDCFFFFSFLFNNACIWNKKVKKKYSSSDFKVFISPSDLHLCSEGIFNGNSIKINQAFPMFWTDLRSES